MPSMIMVLTLNVLQARATPLSPSEWREMLRTAVSPAGLGSSTGEEVFGTAGTASRAEEEGTPPGAVLLDVRNAYEWDAGHFRGAARPLEVHLGFSGVSRGILFGFRV